MEKNIGEKKQKVLDEFKNTRKKINTIAIENNLSLEEVYAILEEYNETNEITRPGKISFPPKRKDESDEDVRKLYESIYQLRKQKKTYVQISNETGLNYSKVRMICKKVFKEKNEEEPKEGYSTMMFSNEVKKTYEKIYELKKEKKSYEYISEQTGLSRYMVELICKKIFDEKGERIPETLIERRSQTDESKKIDEMIFNSVQQGKKYREVQEQLKDIGISLTTERIRQRNERKALQNQKDLAKMILNLMTTKMATLEQVQIIADYYGVDLEKTMNSLEER